MFFGKGIIDFSEVWRYIILFYKWASLRKIKEAFWTQPERRRYYG
jgi:hypothetical protein